MFRWLSRPRGPSRGTCVWVVRTTPLRTGAAVRFCVSRPGAPGSRGRLRTRISMKSSCATARRSSNAILDTRRLLRPVLPAARVRRLLRARWTWRKLPLNTVLSKFVFSSGGVRDRTPSSSAGPIAIWLRNLKRWTACAMPFWKNWRSKRAARSTSVLSMNIDRGWPIGLSAFPECATLRKASYS